MNRWQVVGLLLCILSYVVIRSDSTVSATPETQKVVSGILAELAKANYEFGWQYDSVRRDCLDLARESEERGTFKVPAWMSERLSRLSTSSTAQDVRSAYREVSERLWEAQSGESFERGRNYALHFIRPKDDANGKCADCDGSGRVGDGRVFSECLNCGGDGVIDDSDRKEEVEIIETSKQERSGDQVSRVPVSVNAGSGNDRSVHRAFFPRLRRLFKR